VRFVNRLGAETSPYLRQHADNPVDWHPWGDEALALAAADDKPVFLSVGYSACHWCHVMAHESFEDPATAEVMNELFVNVKVDREERPDVDAISMQACQAMTGGGGWPTSVWLTPDGRPFYAGTYFPKDARPGMPAFVDVCHALAEAWANQRDEIDAQAGRLREALQRSLELATLPGDSPEADAARVRSVAREQLISQIDPQYGGFGRAPKFPQAMSIELLLPTHTDAVRHTLDSMAAGGMYDQLGGGFHRYSVDAYWLVPHFEKMLYDQALLTRAYLHAFLTTGEHRYRQVVEETVGYVLRDLQHPDGGWYSAEDADSEGVEGKFFVWSLDELTEVAGADAIEAIRYWGVTSGGNFEGANILHVVDPTEERPVAVERARAALFARREQRVRPGLDDKVLLAWNALFLRSLAEAAASLQRDDWLDAARTNARFLLDQLRRADGRLLRSWQAERGAHLLAYAEDYAALLEALVTLAEADDVAWLTDARVTTDAMLDLFRDPQGALLFITGSDAEQLVVRPKDVQDNATPAANSLAASGLLRLGTLTGDDRYNAAGRAILRELGPLLDQHPTAFSYALAALERAASPPLEIAIIGEPGRADTDALRTEVWGRLLRPHVTVTAAPDKGAQHTPLLADRVMVDGRATAYVCERFECQMPVTDAAALRAQLA